LRIRPGAGLAVRADFPPAPALEREEQQLATFGLVCRRHGTGAPALVAAREDHVLFYVPLTPVAAPRLLSVAVQNRPTHPITDQDRLKQTNTNVNRRSHHDMPFFIVAPRSPHPSLPCTHARTHTHICTGNIHRKHTANTPRNIERGVDSAAVPLKHDHVLGFITLPCLQVLRVPRPACRRAPLPRAFQGICLWARGGCRLWW
jgi:hypothetical protein